ncbi:MAG TPA: hypothetical protein VFE82_06115 [Ramlibacter sp.]|jgi:hypothetical protein|uniref:hypothetical protein n=1 Tax=Ramlibacter sp. TaxID=1917967 RepID=UPI002D46C533|nr:hypothetical protein [Ramlibacter sp.]HZY18039.1 hypothetical protein [Ramlibacter sp.]
MLAWFWFWAPPLHLPRSGDAAPRIQPAARWFFEGIPIKADGLEERGAAIDAGLAELQRSGGPAHARLARRLLPPLQAPSA